MGIGGLGHLAIQFAKAWGCEVFAFSSSASKQGFATELGAHHFVDTSEGYESVAGALDYILVTAGGANVDWASLMGALAPDGQIIMMGNPGFAPVPLQLAKCLLTPCGVKGSAGCSSGNYLRMLRFAALHGITPIVEVFAPSEVNQAVAKVQSGEVRFRAVVQFHEEDREE